MLRRSKHPVFPVPVQMKALILFKRTAVLPSTSAIPSLPLVVAVDGTLIKTDLSHEAVFQRLSTQPLGAVLSLLRGQAMSTARIAHAVGLDVRTIPVNEEVRALIEAARAADRPVYLAWAGDRTGAEALADHCGPFDGVFASDDGNDLKAENMARRLVKAFGDTQFDYVGNAMSDLPVWRCARTAYLVGGSASVRRAVERVCGDVRIVSDRRIRPSDCIRAMRLHQWLKNLLILVPGLAAHSFDPSVIGPVLLAFFSFSFCASSVYMLNDLLDLDSDRQHHAKRRRPFASGAVPLAYGLILALASLLVSLGLAFLVSPEFVLVLVAYYAMTLAYSLALKRRPIIDVLVLAILYGLRLVAGGVAFSVPLSKWLIVFSLFFFLALALIKRIAELQAHRRQGKHRLVGRAYDLGDLMMLEKMAAASGFVALLVLGLYINSSEIVRLYAHPQILWGGGLILLYWLCRMLMLAQRGDMNEDPVIFAATDWVSLACGALLGVTMAAAVQ